MAKGRLLIEGGSVKGNTAQGASVIGAGIYYPSGPQAMLLLTSLASGNVGEPAPGAGADVQGGGIDLKRRQRGHDHRRDGVCQRRRCR